MAISPQVHENRLASFPVFLKSDQRKVAKMRLVLAIPTAGRPALLSEVLHDITRQTRLPDFVVVSVSGAEDVDERALEDLPFPCMVVTGRKGASVQRNRAIEMLGPEDVLLLLDDDFLMAPDYVAQTVQLFRDHPDVAVATGRVLADGISGPGYDYREGLARLQAGAGGGTGTGDGGLTEAYNGYGCNMAVRARPVLEHRLRFDEALPLYAWLEDVDFSRRLAAYGRVVRSEALRGVHLGSKSGRTPGVKLGYSQIANPAYLIAKGTMAPRRALRLMLGNMAANLLYAIRPEPWIDRRGRLRGNLMALRDLALRRARPDRILDLS